MILRFASANIYVAKGLLIKLLDKAASIFGMPNKMIEYSEKHLLFSLMAAICQPLPVRISDKMNLHEHANASRAYYFIKFANVKVICGYLHALITNTHVLRLAKFIIRRKLLLAFAYIPLDVNQSRYI